MSGRDGGIGLLAKGSVEQRNISKITLLSVVRRLLVPLFLVPLRFKPRGAPPHPPGTLLSS